MGSKHAETVQCISISFEGERCGRKTADSTGLCALHRRYFMDLLEIEILHCDDCPLPIRDKLGVVDVEKTKEKRCSRYMTFAKGLCFFEVGDVFNGFGDREAFLKEMEWVLQKEKLLIKRNMMFMAKSAGFNPEVGKLLDTYFSHIKKTGEAAGMIGTGKGSGIPVRNEDEALNIIAELTKGGTSKAPDIEDAPYKKATGIFTERDKQVTEADLSGGPLEKKPQVKSQVFKDLTEDEEDGV